MTLTVIDAAGSPQQMGHAHGEQARDLIEQSLDGWREAMAKEGHEPRQLVQALARESGLAPALRRELPWVMTEIEGIAAGANASVHEIFALNCLDEAWWWGEKGPGCSAVGLGSTASGAAICGQTMDLDPWMDGTQIALRLAPTNGPSQVMLSRAGLVGLCGANEAGVAVLVNTLSQLPVSSDGVIVAGALRSALAAESVADAVAALKALPHASGQAYTLVERGTTRGLECGAGVVAEYTNDTERPNDRWHTNHPLAMDYEDDSDGDAKSSPTRMTALEEQVGTVNDTDDLKKLLANGDSGICMYPGRWPDGSVTFGTLAIELGASPHVQLAPGPADRTSWHDVPFP